MELEEFVTELCRRSTTAYVHLVLGNEDQVHDQIQQILLLLSGTDMCSKPVPCGAKKEVKNDTQI